MEKGYIKRFGMAMMATLIIFMMVTTPAIAKLTLNTIDPIVTLSSNNRQVLVTGPIVCDQGEKLSLEVMVTQRTTGAVSTGNLQMFCTGTNQTWAINTNTQGANTFEEGSAVAWALATTRDHGTITDAVQWSRIVTVAK